MTEANYGSPEHFLRPFRRPVDQLDYAQPDEVIHSAHTIRKQNSAFFQAPSNPPLQVTAQRNTFKVIQRRNPCSPQNAEEKQVRIFIPEVLELHLAPHIDDQIPLPSIREEQPGAPAFVRSREVLLTLEAEKPLTRVGIYEQGLSARCSRVYDQLRAAILRPLIERPRNDVGPLQWRNNTAQFAGTLFFSCHAAPPPEVKASMPAKTLCGTESSEEQG
ncbi:hypothetical protein [Halopseudomonas aestusnigri]|uniref:hypothetical protein n=1 Tax=Halopseudomonas aestusnigri TaxID=857252 RepID=UPI00300256D9